MTERVVLQSDDVSRALMRISHQILEANHGGADLVLLGIPTRGVPLAQRLGNNILAIESSRVAADHESGDSELNASAALQRFVGALDITMYRDDLRRRPLTEAHPTRIPDTGIDGKTVVLVDDVLFSGRTIRAALDAISDLGRPRAVQLAVLVDRGHRELPIRADFVGKNLPSARSERISVELAEIDGTDRVVIRDGGTA
ncbi:bifunctional pyr operon transcriptional regulator/uracil phosphoribosyltransferase PyrR [Gulosibacter bifidus]|uniref:Bifunctional protein PyrR n=1 Tax=Gulosibacter bifidus TaxID=272239 RepID=A0ABW5RG99_9MICO|nr:bifunctional pyr operon transcriptional regulator/uracil phosphoribosyltransferase PyrR [Gulosibacter bifidus]